MIRAIFFMLLTGYITHTRMAQAHSASEQHSSSPGQTEDKNALEINILWPFFPGGLTDVKLLRPIVGSGNTRGELIIGAFSDFSWRARDANAGKVATLAAKFGYRQYLWSGFHIETTVNTGWRQEKDNPNDGSTLNAFVGRLWSFAGYQHSLSERWYMNVRGGLGVHLWRTDRYGSTEKKLVPVGDLNLGIRF